jgi:hypothetical protein
MYGWACLWPANPNKTCHLDAALHIVPAARLQQDLIYCKAVEPTLTPNRLDQLGEPGAPLFVKSGHGFLETGVSAGKRPSTLNNFETRWLAPDKSDSPGSNARVTPRGCRGSICSGDSGGNDSLRRDGYDSTVLSTCEARIRSKFPVHSRGFFLSGVERVEFRVVRFALHEADNEGRRDAERTITNGPGGHSNAGSTRRSATSAAELVVWKMLPPWNITRTANSVSESVQS